MANPNAGGTAPAAGEVDGDSSCSTPYVSAPSSPGRGSVPSYFFSAPASPVHFILSSAPCSPPTSAGDADSGAGSFEFEFSPRGSMISADELFLNGQIRPMRPRPPTLAPLLDADENDDGEAEESGAGRRDSRLRSRSVHRRTRSMSPLRNQRFQWAVHDDDATDRAPDLEIDPDLKPSDAPPTTPPSSRSSSSSSSSGRNSKRWIFLKDLLYRSKSEGRGDGKEKDKFWLAIAFSPSKEKDKSKPPAPPPAKAKAASAARRPSAHEKHYAANRAATEEMRRRTFLPYRPGLLGCLGISTRGYGGAVSGIAKTLNTVSSR